MRWVYTALFRSHPPSLLRDAQPRHRFLQTSSTHLPRSFGFPCLDPGVSAHACSFDDALCSGYRPSILNPGRGRQAGARRIIFSPADGDTSRGKPLKPIKIVLVVRRVGVPWPGKESWPAARKATRPRISKSIPNSPPASEGSFPSASILSERPRGKMFSFHWSGKTSRNLANSLPRVAQTNLNNLPR
jgi:hypothetical protein